eukprot:scaffold39914_cov62-Phaeocystis_antarctica.AAC.4
MLARACRACSARWTWPATTASCRTHSTKRSTSTAARAAERAAPAARKASVTATQREAIDSSHETSEGRRCRRSAVGRTETPASDGPVVRFPSGLVTPDPQTTFRRGCLLSECCGLWRVASACRVSGYQDRPSTKQRCKDHPPTCSVSRNLGAIQCWLTHYSCPAAIYGNENDEPLEVSIRRDG